MGKTRQAKPNGKERSDQSRKSHSPGRPDPASTARPRQPTYLPASKPTDQNENDQSLEYSSLAPINQIDPTERYRSLRLKAETALEDLCDSPETPPNVRAAAARTLLELVGAIGSKAKREDDQGLAGSDLEPETMTLGDIERELRRLGEV